MSFLSSLLSHPIVPNTLTIGRLLAIPIIILSLALANQGNKLVASFTAIAYLLAALSDLLDGYLARKYNNESNLGRFLDPMADKLLASSALIMMIPLGYVQSWVVFLIIAREMAVTSLRAIAMEKGLVISASAQGKQKTLAQNIAIFCLLWHHQLLWASTQRVGTIILYVALIATYWSGGLYFYRFLKENKN
ncbi:MAG: CDP-diacylglycerol--glycerol-3-phosphate 3-phosphatidyltransferase [Deltaproteobacteria bacterium]|jgi:CDP-diacylglycerol--glycerol-3-phosphate 3-phosphatidyltransferase|nr:CDP-diacylglycerol--glycerol-3-phosphate 3-phosphatidyltransferase [Deltaproteobacteria bacterium]